MSFPDRLQTALKNKKLTQAQLADLVGTSRASVSAWCSGRKHPSQKNLEAISSSLDVPAAWLQYGDGPGPERDLRAERKQYQEDLHWYWRPAPPDHGRQLGNPAGFAFDVDMATLARETGQNSLDELLAGEQTVRLEYSVIELAGQHLQRFRAALRFDRDLLPHLRAAAEGDQKASAVIQSSLDRLDDEDRLILIRIADYNATGLIGPEYDSGRFMAVCRNTLDSQKADETAGGSYGLGKATMWSASGVGLVVANSKLSVPEEDVSDNRLFARLEIPWHEGGSDAWAGPAWFGAWDETEKCTRSYGGNEALAQDLYLARTAPEPGTSFLIVAAYDPSGSAEDIDEMAEQIARATAESFWAAMVPRGDEETPRLRVTVRTQRGNKQLSEREIDPSDYVKPLVEALAKHYDDDVVDRLADDGDLVRLQVPLSIPARTEDGGHEALDHEATLLVSQLDLSDDDHTPNALNRISYLRGNLMRIQAPKLSSLPLGARPFHAIVLAGTADGDEISDRHAERFLRASEPPAHDRWIGTPEITARYARGAKRRLDEFDWHIKQAVREAVRAGSSDISDGPDSLKQLLRLVRPPDENARRPRTKTVKAEVDTDGAWRVEATLAMPPVAHGWRFTPILKFGTESGPSLPVAWRNLTAEANCEVTDMRVRSAAKARTVRISGVSDPTSHPVDSGRARVVLDLRDVREAEGGDQ